MKAGLKINDQYGLKLEDFYITVSVVRSCVYDDLHVLTTDFFVSISACTSCFNCLSFASASVKTKISVCTGDPVRASWKKKYALINYKHTSNNEDKSYYRGHLW